jgi:hypothetical protein
MMDPAFKKALEHEGIILTNWKELIEKRAALPGKGL